MSKTDKRTTSLFDGRISTTTADICPNAPPELQLYWLQSKHSLLSYALSKLAFFSRLSKDKLKEDEKRNGKILKVYRDHNKNVTETLRTINMSELSKNKELRTKLLNKILSQQQQSMQLDTSTLENLTNRGLLRINRCPEEIYKRNLKRFETLLTIAASTSSSSSTSSFGGVKRIFNVNANADKTKKLLIDENNNFIFGVDENQNLLEKTIKKGSSGSGSLLTQIKRRPIKRIISSSKNRVEVDVHFLDWIKSKMASSESAKNATTGTNESLTALAVTTTTTGSSPDSNKKAPSKKRDKNNNANTTTSGKRGNFTFPRRGEGRNAKNVSNNKRSKSRGKGTTSTSTSTRTTTTTTTSSSQAKSSELRRCQNCGPCAGKGALSAAPPAYLDYGDSGSVNEAGSAWKGKRKGDPVMDRLKNVDVVEEMTYLVPTPDCCGGGDGDACCGEMDGAEEDDECEYYAVCESCGEMEPVPEDLKRKLKGRKKRKGKSESTPVTYSRRQRFNFKNKGDMCDEDDGPPYLYEGLQCPGPGCRCSCCVAGLRRNPDCGCKCCQTIGPARKCSSFDEFPVGKNPVIRKILCPEEECAKRREACKKVMPDNSGMYRFDVKNQIFERQVPRTPTPIVLEVEVPKPLTKQEILALGRDIQAKKQVLRNIARDCIEPCCCPVQEEEPVFLPPIYGQCNPPQCQPCQPCCVPNYCCQPCQPPCQPQTQGAAADPKSGQEFSSISGYSYDDGSKHTYAATTTTTRPPPPQLSKNYSTNDKTPANTKSKTTSDSNNNDIAEMFIGGSSKRMTNTGGSSESLPTE